MGGPNATLSLYGSDDANSIESIDISANGQGLLLSRDMVNMTMDSNDGPHLNNVGRIYFAALDGQENIHVHDLSGTDVKQARHRSRAPGNPNASGSDGQPDHVTLDGTAGADSLW